MKVPLIDWLGHSWLSHFPINTSQAGTQTATGVQESVWGDETIRRNSLSSVTFNLQQQSIAFQYYFQWKTSMLFISCCSQWLAVTHEWCEEQVKNYRPWLTFKGHNYPLFYCFRNSHYWCDKGTRPDTHAHVRIAKRIHFLSEWMKLFRVLRDLLETWPLIACTETKIPPQRVAGTPLSSSGKCAVSNMHSQDWAVTQNDSSKQGLLIVERLMEYVCYKWGSTLVLIKSSSTSSDLIISRRQHNDVPFLRWMGLFF